MIVEVPIQMGLIQSVRVIQAIMEAGVTVSIHPKHNYTYQYLAKFFTTHYTNRKGQMADVEISHSKPFVRIGSETRPLLYPKSVPHKCRALWQENRQGVLFIGLIPDHRKAALQQWKGRAEIVETSKGRKGTKRYWDPTYYAKMSGAEFGLCPDGGFAYTYRFVENILCGVTPIVQTEVDWYKDFYYHKWNDKKLERKYVEENFNLAVERFTLPKSVILQNLLTRTQ